MYYTDTERLTALINFLEISPLAFSKETGIPSATIYNTMNGVGTGLSKANLRSIAKRYTQISPGWLLTGDGEMLKLDQSDKKKSNEDRPLGAEDGYFFPSNLNLLMAINEMRADNLAPLIEVSISTLTDLMDGQLTPSLSLLLRLRKVLGVSLDVLVTWDLRAPENMQILKDEQIKAQKTETQMAEMQSTLQAIKSQLELHWEEIKKIKEQSSDKGDGIGGDKQDFKP